MICPNCQKDIKEGSLFCKYCGTKTEDTEKKDPESPENIEDAEYVENVQDVQDIEAQANGSEIVKEEILESKTEDIDISNTEYIDETLINEDDSKVAEDKKTFREIISQKKLLIATIATVLLLLSAASLFFIFNMEKYAVPTTAKEANALFEKLEKRARKSIGEQNYAKAADDLVIYNSIANELIETYQGGVPDAEGLLKIAEEAKKVSYTIIEANVEELVFALDKKNNLKGIAAIFNMQMLNEKNKSTLIPIIVDVYAEKGDFERVDHLLRFYIRPFTQDSLDKTLAIQERLNDKYKNFEKGWQVVDIGEFDKAESFKNGFAKVAKEGGKDTAGNPLYKWGLIDTEGNLVVEVKYDEIGEFLEGRAAILKDNKWGFIDENGQEIIPPIYEELKEPMAENFYAYAKRDPEKVYKGFYNGFAAVRKSDKWGFIDHEGKALGEGFIYTDVQIFSENCASVKIDEHYGLLASNGSYIIEPNTVNENDLIFEVIRPIFEGLSGVNWNNRTERGVINREGYLLFNYSEEEIDLVQDYREGLASVRKINEQKKAYWGFLDRHGDIVIPIIYDEVTVFIDGVAKVKKGNKYGLINRLGDTILAIEYDDITMFEDGFAIIGKDGQKGVVNLAGEIIVSPQYSNINMFSNGVAGFEINGKWGILDESGTEIVPPIFEGIKGYNNGVAPAKYNNKWGFTDISGFYVVEPIFDEAYEFSDGLAAVKLANKYKYIKLDKIPANVSGQVVDVFGQHMPDVKLTVRQLGKEEPVSEVLTNNEGVFRTVLPQGNYVFSAQKENYLEIDSYFTMDEGKDSYTSKITIVRDSEGEKADARIKIGNALTGEGLPNVTVKIRTGLNNRVSDYIKDDKGKEIELLTSQDGFFNVNLPAGAYTAESTKEDFASSYINFIVSKELNYQTNPIISTPMTKKLAEGETRITLQWGAYPEDLDSHLIGPTNDSYEQFHIFYPVKAQRLYNAMLDKDDVSGNGFETTTIYKQSDGFYKYSVFDYTNRDNYSSSQMSLSGARVSVYRDYECVAVFDIPTNRVGILWEVFEIRGDKIIPLNNITSHVDTNFYTY